MKTRYILALVALLPVLAACSKPETAAPAADAAPATSAPAASTPAAGDAAAAAPAQAAAEAPNNNPPVVPDGPAPVEGTDYTVIADGQPFEPADGKIEVAEAFNYICPACAQFEPLFNQWKAKEPSDVRVVYVPAQFRPDFRDYAKVYYAAQALGIDKQSHDAIFKAIHQDKTLPGEGQSIDLDKIAQWYTQYGVTADQFKQTMGSFAVAGKMSKANQFLMRAQIGGTPSVIVAGKYLVKGKSYSDFLRITDHLIARERQAAGAK
ncbi:thiol:disulfide interchange protein DsbA [Pseudoxanthomonas sp. GM95]|uniref:thiol:disulfide interchange protein DsbA/DsbL n=1 Tax=Pseudoxanthomonas sp. GM95 TaxID=1881043 RepID=UPI0008C93E1A|nr:thiol:disulfide interchange protein DsbA/DsbL [Pseudoxanthomonas sp. GM95]SEM37387.1 thiol:disulfide interchange protein DsbA [Pseudoxanthomonas sp. GM95]